MLPYLTQVGRVSIPTHGFFVALGVATAAAMLWWRARGRGPDPRLAVLVAGGIFVGAIFAKLGTTWQSVPQTGDASVTQLWAYGGQSVLGGLAGAYLGVLLTKRLVGYRGSTGDWFAPAVAAGLAVGRVGCFLTEQVGTPTSLPWGISVSPEMAAAMPYCPSCHLGVPMHPSFLYEIGFHLVALAALLGYGSRLRRPGDSFKLYLLSYAIFRFGVEFVRDNPEMAAGLSGSQIFIVISVPIVTGIHLWQRKRGASRVEVLT